MQYTGDVEGEKGEEGDKDRIDPEKGDKGDGYKASHRSISARDNSLIVDWWKVGTM
jgi:hypothetical protein